jgi:hypothetical protein
MIVEALYLPQFHRFPENDKWWGEGFTEWSNLKNAEKLYKDHLLLKQPSWGNYDLSNIKDMERQYSYAKEIGVDIFSVYHYWSNGSLLMEKPIENLLENKRVDFKFYLNWANHNFYNKVNFSQKKLLWEQKYDDKFIGQHVAYLSAAMDDHRYHRIDNKPVLNIYDPRSIPNFSDFICKYKDLFWERFGMEIHLRVTLKDFKDFNFINENLGVIDSVYEYQPYFANHSNLFRHYWYEINLRFRRDFLKKLTIFDANDVVKRIIKYKKRIDGMPYGYGAYTGWDTTPRWGVKGIVHKGFDNALFNKQVDEIKRKSNNDDFLVITAWNEWGEGAILEPCQERVAFKL